MRRSHRSVATPPPKTGSRRSMGSSRASPLYVFTKASPRFELLAADPQRTAFEQLQDRRSVRLEPREALDHGKRAFAVSLCDQAVGERAQDAGITRRDPRRDQQQHETALGLAMV